jgi:hypothetical protein
MKSRTKGRVLIVVLGFGLPVSCVALAPLQSLRRVRLGVTGGLDAPLSKPVTMTVATPGSYGLTLAEVKSGLPPLNDPSQVQVALGNIFEAELPGKITFCTTQPLAWALAAGVPPPPARLKLRFSDAPNEEYWISGSGPDDYTVLLYDEAVVPHEAASWKLKLGPIARRGSDEAGVPVWVLRIHLTRQTPAEPPTA